MGSKTGRDSIHHQAFKVALAKVAAASRRLRRGREKRTGRNWLPHSAPAATAAPAPTHPDPVRIAVLAMESVGRASMRAAFTGIEVRVAVPDDATAAIFRAALTETTRSRATDQLVRIVVD
jgi:hypothetical protein